MELSFGEFTYPPPVILLLMHELKHGDIGTSWSCNSKKNTAFAVILLGFEIWWLEVDNRGRLGGQLKTTIVASIVYGNSKDPRDIRWRQSASPFFLLCAWDLGTVRGYYDGSSPDLQIVSAEARCFLLASALTPCTSGPCYAFMR